MKTCKERGCQKPTHSRGWCSMHYRRWYTHRNLNFTNQPDRQTRSLARILSETGATYRQLDHWARKGYISTGTPGTGKDRLWSAADLEWIHYLVEASWLSLPQVARLIRDSEQLVEKSA